MVIGYDGLGTNKIYITMDASKHCSRAVLSFGPTWESAQLVAFDSATFKGAGLNYFIHEKELPAIVCALKKWHSELFGCPFLIYMDPKTLENFASQKDLSSRQARWMRFMSQFDARVVYLKGTDNSAADSLSRYSMVNCSLLAELTAPFLFQDLETLDVVCTLHVKEFVAGWPSICTWNIT